VGSIDQALLEAEPQRIGGKTKKLQKKLQYCPDLPPEEKLEMELRRIAVKIKELDKVIQDWADTPYD
jgi:hypothetical protein